MAKKANNTTEATKVAEEIKVTEETKSTTPVSLFVASTTGNASTVRRQLEGSTQLTSLSTEIATKVLDTTMADKTKFELIAASQTDINALDRLVTENYDLHSVNVEFLRKLDTSTIDGLLKSNMSKRSHCKAKEMTMDNYKSMMAGLIAELLIRRATGNEKGKAFGTVGSRGTTGLFSDEALATLAADQEDLRREIRNLQSKKSILKKKLLASKAEDKEFAGTEDEYFNTNDQWKLLCAIEDQLFGIRIDGVRGARPAKTVTVDTTKNALAEKLADVDLSSLKAADAKKLLEEIAGLAADAKPEENPVDEEPADKESTDQQ